MAPDPDWVCQTTPFGAKYWVNGKAKRVAAVDPAGNELEEYALVNDLVQLPEAQLNPEGITGLVQRRYAADQIYSWVGASGTVLVAVNPFKELGIYTPATASKYLSVGDAVIQGVGSAAYGRLPPHAFGLAAEAYRGLRRSDQALLISGDSGSGKTEATKHCLALLAEAAGDQVGKLEQKVLAANPVLEAYGNASTCRNSNSSRFGKWTALHFSTSGKLQRASVETYLLEKARVASHGEGERGYHIYYQLAESREMLPASLSLRDPSEFRYLRPASCGNRTIQDTKDFQDLQHSLVQLGFTEEEMQALWRTTAAALHLGNLLFDATPDTGSGVGSRVQRGDLLYDPEAEAEGEEEEEEHPLSAAARLLVVEEKELEDALTKREIEVRGAVTASPMDPEAARTNTDGLAKLLHSRIFAWLVRKINMALDVSGGAATSRFIGILDIFGFEIFEVNSFEQLCINFANEKLQAHFNNCTFKEEQGIYAKEGIPFKSLEYIDNAEVLALLESIREPIGFLPLLDDMCKMPKGTEKGFLDKCVSSYRGLKCWKSAGVNEHRSFTIAHYAGAVTYQLDGFMDKNRDQEAYAHLRLLQGSECEFLRSLLQVPAGGAPASPRGAAASPRGMPSLSPRGAPASPRGAPAAPSPAGGEELEPRRSMKEIKAAHEKRTLKDDAKAWEKEAGKKVTVTASGHLRRQLAELMGIVQGCEVKYIRCIKPNDEKVHDSFEVKRCMQQLTYSGVFETVNIRKRGLPFRMSHEQFVKRYTCIAAAHPLRPLPPSGTPWAKREGKDRGKAEAILDYIGATSIEAPGLCGMAAAVGKSLVFYRAEAANLLELLRSMACDLAARRITRVLRLNDARKFRKAAAEANEAVAAALAAGSDLELARRAVLLGQSRLLGVFGYRPKAMADVERLRRLLQERLEVTEELSGLVRTCGDVEAPSAADLTAMISALGQAAALTASGAPRSEEQAAIEEAARVVLQAKGSEALEKQIAQALRLPVRQVLETMVQRAESFGYSSPSVDEVRQLLALPEVEFTARQLKGAESCGMKQMAQDLQIRIIGLRAETSPQAFELERWPTLRHMETWYRFRNWDSMVSRMNMTEEKEMVRFQNYPIHATLLERTTIYTWGQAHREGREKLYHDHDGRLLFRALLGYMGDLQHPYPDTLAVEFVNTAVGSLSLASEAFAQLVKQLTQNPSAPSAERGWQLLAMLLDYTAPSCPQEAELLAGFVWLHAPASVRLKLLDKLLKWRAVPVRPTRRLALTDVRPSVRSLWEGGGRPSLKLPRGSMKLPYSTSFRQ